MTDPNEGGGGVGAATGAGVWAKARELARSAEVRRSFMATKGQDRLVNDLALSSRSDPLVDYHNRPEGTYWKRPGANSVR